MSRKVYFKKTLLDAVEDGLVGVTAFDELFFVFAALGYLISKPSIGLLKLGRSCPHLLFQSVPVPFQLALVLLLLGDVPEEGEGCGAILPEDLNGTVAYDSDAAIRHLGVEGGLGHIHAPRGQIQVGKETRGLLREDVFGDGCPKEFSWFTSQVGLHVSVGKDDAPVLAHHNAVADFLQHPGL